MNSKGGILRAVGYMLVCTLANLLLIASLIYVVAWPMGWFLARCPISGGELDGSQCGADDHLPDQLHLLHPAILFVGGAVVFLAYCGFGDRSRARKWPISAALIGFAAFSALYLVALPQLFRFLHNHSQFVDLLGPFAGTSVFGVGIGGTLWKLFGGPLVHQVTGLVGKAVPRLLGIVLVIAAGAWALLVMYKAAVPPRWAWWTPLVAVALILLAYQFTSPNWPTLHNIFSDRLRRSFDPIANPFPSPAKAPALPLNDGGAMSTGTWQELSDNSRPREGAHLPELILCCSQQRNGIAAGGLRAETFTISPHWVRQGGRSLPTKRYLEAAKSVKRCGRDEFKNIEVASTWLATTGAAFSSAMGRMSLGTTSALLAAVNADLGIWLPNPLVLQEATKLRRELAGVHRASGGNGQRDDAETNTIDDSLTDVKLFPRPRFGYLIKEILGWYSLDDRFVFITDGGHWDDLGLVELLRRDCDIIYCIDASADTPGSFTTLHQALGLASLELDGVPESTVDIEHYLEDMLPTTHYPPQTCAANILVPRAGRPPVKIRYAKLQATQDMDKRLRRFAIADPKFPMYSTLRQFLSPQQFKNLVRIGRFAGQKMVELSHDVAEPPQQPDRRPDRVAAT